MPHLLPLTRFIRKFRRLAPILAAAAAFFIGSADLALAGTAEGVIAGIDENDNTLTLTNGKIYKLPGEFDYSGFRAGQKVTVFYDTDPSGSYVSDIEVQGAKAADTESAGDDDGASGEDKGDNAVGQNGAQPAAPQENGQK